MLHAEVPNQRGIVFWDSTLMAKTRRAEKQVADFEEFCHVVTLAWIDLEMLNAVTVENAGFVDSKFRASHDQMYTA